MKSNGHTGEIVTAIDVGSSKIAIARGHAMAGHIDLIDLTVEPSAGIVQGIVSDSERAIQSIKSALANSGHGLPNAGVTMAFSGKYIRTQGARGMTVVRSEVVEQSDIDRALEAANASPLSSDDEVLGTIVQDYVADGNEGIHRPVGLAARRIEVGIQRIIGQTTSIANLLRTVASAGMQVTGLLPQAIASSQSVLTDREMQEGVCLIDIGAGKTDVAVFMNGTLRHLSVVVAGGNDISADIANSFHIAYNMADQLKVSHGAALAALCEHQLISGSPHISKKEIAQVIQKRLEQILLQVHESLVQSGYWKSIAHGIVLTGGTANMPGLVELCEEIFHMLARVGTSWRLGLGHDQYQRPEHAAVVGALLGGFRVPA